jgi:hypothetical protein
MAVVDVKSVYGTTIKQYYIGASTDSKPTDVQIGAKFLESDTNTTYIFGSDRTWVIDPEHQSLNKVWNADTLEWERQTQPLVNISNASLFVELGSMDVQFDSMNKQLNSIAVILSATSTRVGNISTTLNNISTITGKISNVLSGISNVLSGISARISALSTAIGSTNALLASMEVWLDPLARFGIGFIDDGSATSYYGFQGRTGDWYALRISNGSYLYYYDSADFDTRWASRDTLSYTSFAGMF